MGGTTASMTGPAPPMMQDQKRAGRSRDAQRQYRSGCCQKWGAPPDILISGMLLGYLSVQSQVSRVATYFVVMQVRELSA